MFDGNLIFRSRESFAIIALEYLTQLSQPVEEAYVMSEALSPSVIESLREFDSATIANAIEYFEARDRTTGYATGDLVCQTPEITQPMVGCAISCKFDSTTPGDRRPSGLGELIELVNSAPKPSVLVVEHLGHDRKRSCLFGDMFCTSVEKLGCTGIVTDSNGRDRKSIRKRTPKFQVFCTGWVVSHGYGVFLDLNVTVSICGLTIQPGDLLHGDESGLVSIPKEIVGGVVKRATEVRREEAEFFKFLGSRRFTVEELKRRITPHLRSKN